MKDLCKMRNSSVLNLPAPRVERRCCLVGKILVVVGGVVLVGSGFAECHMVQDAPSPSLGGDRMTWFS